jgi:hypothetical protein
MQPRRIFGTCAYRNGKHGKDARGSLEGRTDPICNIEDGEIQ